MSYRICTACTIPHYENCDTCFGFGVYVAKSGELFPVTANEAIETKVYRGELQPCPECGSTVTGVPETQTEREERDLMREILKSAAGIYANMGTDTPLTYWFGNQDIPILRPSERIRVVLIREHDEPHPLPVGEVFAGVTGYAEGVAV